MFVCYLFSHLSCYHLRLCNKKIYLTNQIYISRLTLTVEIFSLNIETWLMNIVIASLNLMILMDVNMLDGCVDRLMNVWIINHRLVNDILLLLANHIVDWIDNVGESAWCSHCGHCIYMRVYMRVYMSVYMSYYNSCCFMLN